MKRIWIILLAAALVTSMCACAAAEGGWYCPNCGRVNYENYCPTDGHARPEDQNTTGSCGNYTVYSMLPAVLNQRLATRTGPGTQYDEPGSFFAKGEVVTVLSKAYDERNKIWWVQVEFTHLGSNYRAYTGVKRFTGLDLSLVPEEKVIGRCRVNQTTECFYGPSYEFKQIKRSVPAGVECAIYGYATSSYVNTEGSDFIQIEFYDPGLKCTRRAWVTDWSVDDYEMYYGF